MSLQHTFVVEAQAKAWSAPVCPQPAAFTSIVKHNYRGEGTQLSDRPPGP